MSLPGSPSKDGAISISCLRTAAAPLPGLPPPAAAAPLPQPGLTVFMPLSAGPWPARGFGSPCPKASGRGRRGKPHYHPTPITRRLLKIKTPGVGEAVEELEPRALLVGTRAARPLWKPLGGSSKSRK